MLRNKTKQNKTKQNKTKQKKELRCNDQEELFSPTYSSVVSHGIINLVKLTPQFHSTPAHHPNHPPPHTQNKTIQATNMSSSRQRRAWCASDPSTRKTSPDLAEARATIAHLEEQLQDCTRRRDVAAAKCELLEAEVMATRTAASDSATQARLAEQAELEAKSNAAQAAKALEEATKKQAQLEAEARKAHERIETLQLQRAQDVGSNALWSAIARQLVGWQNRWREAHTLSAGHDSHDDMRAQLDLTMETAKQVQQVAEDLVACARRDAVEATRRAKAAEAMVAETTQGGHAIANELAETRAATETLQKQLALANERAQAAEERANAAEAHLSSVTADTASANERAQAAEERANAAEAHLSSVTADAASANERAQAAEERANAAEAHLSSVTMAQQEAQQASASELSTAQEELASANARLAELEDVETREEATKAQLEAAKAQLKALQASQDSVSSSLSMAQEQLAHSTRSLASANARLAELEDVETREEATKAQLKALQEEKVVGNAVVTVPDVALDRLEVLDALKDMDAFSFLMQK